MQVSKLLVIALVCVVLISGAEMSAGAEAVPRALCREPASSRRLCHTAAAAVGVDRRYPPGCCHPLPNCCVHVVDDDAAPAASDDSP